MQVAYATIYDATATSRGFASFNGVGYYIGRSLQTAGLTLDFLGPLRETYAPLLFAKQMYHRKVTKKIYNRHRETLSCRDYSRQIERKLRTADYDVLFSGLSVGSQPVAHVRNDIPTVIWTDSTLASAVGFYPEFCRERMVWKNIEAGLRNERAAVNRADLLIYSSEWARREAIEQYDLPPSKVKVVPFGANQMIEPRTDEVAKAIGKRPTDVCKLLFVGMDWHRKGGEVALQTAEYLHSRGLRVELNLVGGRPEESRALPPYVRAHGLITRKTEEGARRLAGLFSEAHFLILASKADASPHVLVEANSHGVPCAASNVGGIGSIIENGKNGQLFAPDANGKAYGEWIAQVFFQAEEYQRLAHSSFAEYQKRLNWPAAGRSVARLLGQLTPVRQPADVQMAVAS